MNLLYLSIAPGLAIMLYVYAKDKYNREPVLHLIISFFLGVFSALPAVYIEFYSNQVLNQLVEVSLLHTFIMAFVVVALTEEYCKYFMVRYYAYPKKTFDEPFDGIVYCVMVSMGFATIENIGYVYQHGASTGLIRMFLSVPAHASFAVMMGYYVGLAKFNPPRAYLLRLTGIFFAVIFHGTYDCLLFLGENGQLSEYASGGMLIVGALSSYIIGVRLSLKAIRKQQLHSKQLHDRRFPLF
ncbi:PrsW family intramembrane metalloprotease [Segetibacter koreensis]|uniref:PrsW family intramembrane metalloprotease n=1 Tax=Segetibacter koreensis TaxID=398037 RepID=UPI000373E2FA|nr:PrsW family glutamic-type intramembrane protease [Segetibacter koreensis]